jgi:hypothetical protein
MVLTIQAVFFIQSIAALLWAVVVAALSVSALFGSRRAATGLKYLLYFMAAAFVFVGLVGTAPLDATVRSLAVAALLLVVARYLGKSSAVAAFYGQRPTEAKVDA